LLSAFFIALIKVVEAAVVAGIVLVYLNHAGRIYLAPGVCGRLRTAASSGSKSASGEFAG
jgi:hypothetical protein